MQISLKQNWELYENILVDWRWCEQSHGIDVDAASSSDW